VMDTETDKPVNPRVFVPLAVIGVAMMLWGFYGLFSNAATTRPGSWFTWFLGAAIAHDFVIAPGVFLAGWVTRRTVPSHLRAPLQAAGVVSAIAFLATMPLVLGFGSSGEPSVLGANYPAGFLLLLIAVWSVTALALVRAWRSGRSSRSA